jgi:hypothetical protein
MKGYIYKLFAGADPATGWIFNDPIFGKPPTLGACVPNIRRVVEKGDWVFPISGRTSGYQPYVVGGFEVDEKIDALAAFHRFPEYRLRRDDTGQVVGNIIVDEQGHHHPLDDHKAFERRVRDYIVGKNGVQIAEPGKIEQARGETLSVLGEILNQPANRVSDLVPRWRRLGEQQVVALRDWLTTLHE